MKILTLSECLRSGVLLVLLAYLGEGTLRYPPRLFAWESLGANLVPFGLILLKNSVHCTSVNNESPPALLSLLPSQSGHGHGSELEQEVDKLKVRSRQPKIIRELNMLNRQSCLSKIVCGVEVAKPPTKKSSTMNDVAYMVKSFFDLFTLGGSSASQDLDDESNESDEEEEDDSNLRSGNRRQNSRRPISSQFSEPPDIEDSLKEFEAFVSEPEGFLFKRNGRVIPENPEQRNCSSTKRSCRIGKLRPGFMGMSNPRFDKTAFLNKKQLELQKATTDAEKLQIAQEVATKLQSPRQCRLLNWFFPQYSTQTTITTISNDPSMLGKSDAVVTSGMCPFTGSELQEMILSSQGRKPQATTAVSVVQTTTTAAPSPNPITVVPLDSLKPKKPFSKPSLTIYGEPDPDSELGKDPLYSLTPPEEQQEVDDEAFQTFGFHKYQDPKQKLKHTLQYFRTTTKRPTPDAPNYNHYFYLNADQPWSSNNQDAKVRVVPKTKATTTTKPTTTTKRPQTSEEDEEEDEEQEQDDKNENEEDDDTNSDEQATPSPPPPELLQAMHQIQHLKNSPPKKKSSQGFFGIPSKVRVRLPFPSLKRWRKTANVPQSINPVDFHSSSNEMGEEQRTRRGTNHHLRSDFDSNESAEKSLVFKSHFEHEESVKEQMKQVPTFFATKKRPVPNQSQHHFLAPYLGFDPPALPKTPPPLPPKSNKKNEKKKQSSKEKEDDSDEENDDEDEEENSDTENDNKSYEDESQESQEERNLDHRVSDPTLPTTTPVSAQTTTKKSSIFSRPIFHIPIIMGSRRKTTEAPTTTTTTTTKPPRKFLQYRNPSSSGPSRNNSTGDPGILKHILSDHGLRTLSTIQHLIYGKDDPPKVHGGPPPDGPPPPPYRGKGPKRRPPHGHKRRRPKPKPYHDQDQEQDDSDEEEEDDESQEEKKKKKTTTTTPKSTALPPVQLPPQVLAVPIYVEGKEIWDPWRPGDEEEFFDEKDKNKKKKPEKYDYDSSEAVDYGPGQGIKTEYSVIVDGVKDPLKKNPNSDRYIVGLPTSWEGMYQELKRQKEQEKLLAEKKKEEKNVPNSDEDSEEEEDEEEGEEAPAPSRNRPGPVRTHPLPHHQIHLEPID